MHSDLYHDDTSVATFLCYHTTEYRKELRWGSISNVDPFCNINNDKPFCLKCLLMLCLWLPLCLNTDSITVHWQVIMQCSKKLHNFASNFYSMVLSVWNSRKRDKTGIFRKYHSKTWYWLWLRCLPPLSTIFKLYRGGQFYCHIDGGNRTTQRKPPTDKLYHIEYHSERSPNKYCINFCFNVCFTKRFNLFYMLCYRMTFHVHTRTLPVFKFEKHVTRGTTLKKKEYDIFWRTETRETKKGKYVLANTTTQRVKMWNIYANIPAVVKLMEYIRNKTKCIHRLSTNQNAEYLYKV